MFLARHCTQEAFQSELDQGNRSRWQIRGCGVMKPEDRLRRSRLASQTRENHTVRGQSS